MRVCLRMRHGERRERGLWDAVVARKSLVSPSEGLGDGDGEIGEPSVLGFRGSKFWARAYGNTRRELRIPQNKGSQGSLPPKKV